MSEKRYFKVEYDEEWYLFDSTTISEQLVKEQAEYGYGVFANSLSPSEVVDLLNELNDERMMYKTTIDKRIVELEEENEQLKQKIQRWKTLYEIKDAEVTARVDTLNKVCEHYTSEVLFKSDTDPNQAVKEVINEILNTEVKK